MRVPLCEPRALSLSSQRREPLHQLLLQKKLYIYISIYIYNEKKNSNYYILIIVIVIVSLYL